MNRVCSVSDPTQHDRSVFADTDTDVQSTSSSSSSCQWLHGLSQRVSSPAVRRRSHSNRDGRPLTLNPQDEKKFDEVLHWPSSDQSKWLSIDHWPAGGPRRLVRAAAWTVWLRQTAARFLSKAVQCILRLVCWAPGCKLVATVDGRERCFTCSAD